MTVARTTRTKALEQTCPVCGSTPGQPCTGRSGPRVSAHAERHYEAIRQTLGNAGLIEHPAYRTELSPTTTSRPRRERRRRAHWAEHDLRCAGPCARWFKAFTIRTVIDGQGRELCDSCYRRESANP